MKLIIDEIEDNACFEHKGDVHVRHNIGKDAKVTVANGTLIVDGDVGDNTKITLQQESNLTVVVGGKPLFESPVIVTDLEILGNVGRVVEVIARNASFKVHGAISPECKLETYNGNISVNTIGDWTSLRTHRGNINVVSMSAHSRATTINGDIHFKQADSSVKQSSFNGSVFKNDVVRVYEEKNLGINPRH